MKDTPPPSRPSVSVVVPVYNGEPFVRRCVACLGAQTLRDIEVLFVDDRSEDGTVAAIERETAGDDRFRLIRQPERTDPLRCRREGVLASAGEFIMFLDVDDEFVPEACERALETIRREGTDLVVFGSRVVPSGGVPEEEAEKCQRFLDREPRRGRVAVTRRFLPELFRKDSWSPSVWNKIVRGDVLRGIYRNFRPEGYLGYGQDFLQTILVFLSIRSLYSDVGLRLHRYRLGDGASVRAEGALSWNRFVRIMSSANTAKALSDHLAGRSDVPPGVRRQIEGRFVSNFRDNAARYVRFLPREDIPRGVSLAVESWGPALFETAAFRSDMTPEILDAALRSSAFPAPGETVRTVGFLLPGKRSPEDDAPALADAVRHRLEEGGIRTFLVGGEEFEDPAGPASEPAASGRADRWRSLVGSRSPDFVFLMCPDDGSAVGDALVLRSLGVRTAAVLRRGTLLSRIGGQRFLRILSAATVSGRAICLDRETEAEVAPWLGFPVAVLPDDAAVSAFPWGEWLSSAAAVPPRDDPVRAARYAVLRDAAAFDRRRSSADRRKNARTTGLAARIAGLLLRPVRRFVPGRALSALLLAAAVLAAGCSTVPITGRRQLSLVSDQEILSSSLTEYRSFMGKAKVSGNRVQSAQVERVGRRIADATERYLRENGLGKEVAGFAWEFNLVQDKEVNAFCMPGGKIVVYTGLMALVSSDDELAVVLGHEVAHAVAKHANERMSQQLLAAAGAQAVGYATKERSAAVQSAAAGVYGLGAQVGALLPFSRRHESEADYMGLALMTLAGYDPDCAPGFWRKMSAAGSGKTPELLSSHPSDASRVAAISAALPEIKAKYRP